MRIQVTPEQFKTTEPYVVKLLNRKRCNFLNASTIRCAFSTEALFGRIILCPAGNCSDPADNKTASLSNIVVRKSSAFPSNNLQVLAIGPFLGGEPGQILLAFNPYLALVNLNIITALLVAVAVLAALLLVFILKYWSQKKQVGALIERQSREAYLPGEGKSNHRAADELNNMNREQAGSKADKESAEKRLIESEQRCKNLIGEAPVGFFTSTREGKFLQINRHLSKMIGYEDPDQAVKEVCYLQQNLYRYPSDRQQLLEKLDHGGFIEGEQVQFKNTDGSLIWVEINAKGIRGRSGEIEFIEGFITDITEQIKCRKLLEDLSNTDGLTGIYNRRYFSRLASIELQRAKRYDENISLLVLDLDCFKNINEVFGHEVGDNVLKGLCVIVEEAIREHDIFGRLGGEEFAVMMPQTGRVGAMDAAERIRLILESALRQKIAGKYLTPTVSVGVTSLEDHEIDLSLEEIVKVAEEAMEKAKVAGRNCVRYKGY